MLRTAIEARALERNAAPARFELCASERAAVPAKKGSCEIQRDGVVLQAGNPNAICGALQVDMTS